MVEMLHEFMADDRLSGILDDRGRFIYISTSEQDRIVEMIEREGKISIADLVAGCNRIINESN